MQCVYQKARYRVCIMRLCVYIFVCSFSWVELFVFKLDGTSFWSCWFVLGIRFTIKPHNHEKKVVFTCTADPLHQQPFSSHFFSRSWFFGSCRERLRRAGRTRSNHLGQIRPSGKNSTVVTHLLGWIEISDFTRDFLEGFPYTKTTAMYSFGVTGRVIWRTDLASRHSAQIQQAFSKVEADFTSANRLQTDSQKYPKIELFGWWFSPLRIGVPRIPFRFPEKKHINPYTVTIPRWILPNKSWFYWVASSGKLQVEKNLPARKAPGATWLKIAWPQNSASGNNGNWWVRWWAYTYPRNPGRELGIIYWGSVRPFYLIFQSWGHPQNHPSKHPNII